MKLGNLKAGGISPQQQAALRAAWMTMLGSVVVFTVLGFVLPGLAELKFAESLTETLAYVFVVIGVMFAVAGHLLYRRATGPNSPPGNLRVVAWALDQSLAAFGVILALFGLPPTDWLVFPVMSLVLLLIHRPQFEKSGGPSLRPPP